MISLSKQARWRSNGFLNVQNHEHGFLHVHGSAQREYKILIFTSSTTYYLTDNNLIDHKEVVSSLSVKKKRKQRKQTTINNCCCSVLVFSYIYSQGIRCVWIKSPFLIEQTLKLIHTGLSQEDSTVTMSKKEFQAPSQTFHIIYSDHANVCMPKGELTLSVGPGQWEHSLFDRIQRYSNVSLIPTWVEISILLTKCIPPAEALFKVTFVLYIIVPQYAACDYPALLQLVILHNS